MGGGLREQPLDLDRNRVKLVRLGVTLDMEVPAGQLVAHPPHNGHRTLVQRLGGIRERRCKERGSTGGVRTAGRAARSTGTGRGVLLLPVAAATAAASNRVRSAWLATGGGCGVNSLPMAWSLPLTGSADRGDGSSRNECGGGGGNSSSRRGDQQRCAVRQRHINTPP